MERERRKAREPGSPTPTATIPDEEPHDTWTGHAQGRGWQEAGKGW